jgi:short-subunit dehydrogenase
MLDVTDLQSFTDYLDRVEDELGPIDILINNAGIIAVGYAIEEHDTVTKRILDVNLYGVILGTKLAAARMLPRATGHIINIASVAGVIPNTGVATYCATKHAVLGFTDAVRLENRRRGIHFSAVLPALVDTEMIAGVGTVRGFKTAEPDDVATAIAGLIRRPRPRIVVPHSASLAVLSQRYLPRATFERLGRMVGAEYIFTDGVDVEKRNSYAIRTGTS